MKIRSKATLTLRAISFKKLLTGKLIVCGVLSIIFGLISL